MPCRPATLFPILIETRVGCRGTGSGMQTAPGVGLPHTLFEYIGSLLTSCLVAISLEDASPKNGIARGDPRRTAEELIPETAVPDSFNI
uniref:Uncharacterized protein n=1 Tax=Tetraselmis sp. GSL018 TaxID=582737 RepID=A0A061SAZ0_9CHLO